MGLFRRKCLLPPRHISGYHLSALLRHWIRKGNVTTHMRGKLTLNTVIKNVYLRFVSVYVVRNSAACRTLRGD